MRATDARFQFLTDIPSHLAFTHNSPWECTLVFQFLTGGSQVIHFSNEHALIPANLEQLIHPSSPSSSKPGATNL